MFVQSRDEFDLWFKAQPADATGVDLDDPPELKLPEARIELRDCVSRLHAQLLREVRGRAPGSRAPSPVTGLELGRARSRRLDLLERDVHVVSEGVQPIGQVTRPSHRGVGAQDHVRLVLAVHAFAAAWLRFPDADLFHLSHLLEYRFEGTFTLDHVSAI
jgi:hypothetical protein